MKKITKVLFLILLLSALRYPLSATYAAVPHLLNYQGRLTDSSGNPLNGSYSLTFRIYDAESAGNLLWEEIQSGVVIQKGIFSVLLGSITPLDKPFDKPYYLQILVNGELMKDNQGKDRQLIASTAYAIRAEKAELAEQAQNAGKVGNVEVSPTPQANKILPLDSNAKLPLSALKVYDSGWFAVSAGNSYFKTHNLGTTKVIAMLWFSTSSDGSNAMAVCKYAEQNNAGFTHGDGGEICTLTPTTCVARTAGYFVNIDFSVSPYGGYFTGYYRIIMLALE